MTKETFEQIYYKYNPVQDYDEIWNFINEKLNILKPKFIAEIGTEFGGSSLLWSTIASENDGVFFGIDPEPLRAKDIVTTNIPTLPSYWFSGVSQNETIIFNLKDKLNDYGNLLDFLFIDGSHEMEDVYQDCKNYIPLIKSNGLIGFHDCGDVNGGPMRGIQKAKEEGIIKFKEEGIYNVRMGIYWFIKE